MLRELSLIMNSQKYMEQKGRDGQINLQDQKIFQVVTQKIEDISKIIQNQDDLKPNQISNKKK